MGCHRSDKSDGGVHRAMGATGSMTLTWKWPELAVKRSLTFIIAVIQSLTGRSSPWRLIRVMTQRAIGRQRK